MSGIEVAGLVLAAFPILLSALDEYRKGFEVLEEWWGFRTSFIEFVDDVNHQLMLYSQVLTCLLDPIIADETELRQLVADADNPRWKDPGLDEALESRLASEHARFIRILNRMEEVISGLKSLLRVQDTGWVDQDTRPWSYHLARLQIGFSKGKHRKVNKLEKFNKELQQILGYSERIIPIADRRNSPEPVALLEKIRQQACSLYSALKLHWTCQCKTRTGHQAYLQLQNHQKISIESYIVFILGPESQNAHKTLKVSLVFRPAREETNMFGASLAYVQKAEDIAALQTQFEDKAIKKGSQLFKMFSRNKKNAVPASATPRPKHPTVGALPTQPVVAPAPPTILISHHHTGRVPLTAEPDAQARSLNQIGDLCSTLRRSQQARGCLGLVVDEYDRTFEMSRPTSDLLRDDSSLSPLSAVINASDQAGFDFPRQQRFQLAAHIASALLQLHASPWLPTALIKDKFSLLTTSNSITGSSPFVSQNFASNMNSNPSMPDWGPNDLTDDETRQALFNLGVIILELIFAQPLEHCPFRTNYLGPNNMPNDQTDISTARAWSRRVLGECGVEIDDVVRRCLDASFGPRPNFRDKRFREAFYVGVIQPLQDYLKTWQVVVP